MNENMGWLIANLDYPLRTTKNLSELVKHGGPGGSQNLSNSFNWSLNITENMQLGPQPITIEKQGTYHEKLQDAFNLIGNDKSALIIVNWFENGMTASKMEIEQAWNNSNDLNLKEISHPQNTDSFSR